MIDPNLDGVPDVPDDPHVPLTDSAIRAIEAGLPLMNCRLWCGIGNNGFKRIETNGDVWRMMMKALRIAARTERDGDLYQIIYEQMGKLLEFYPTE